ncbi:hypothetical protein TB2_036186 [Malus domestica]
MIFNNFQDLASYHVRIGVGTLSTASQYKSYNLLVDTGSDLTWLQSDGCRTHHCFKSVDEPFPVAFDKDGNKRSGILGLGFGSRSFVTQLQSAGQSDGRFSYCFRLEPQAGPTPSFLKFGADIEEKPDLSLTALRKYNDASLHYGIEAVFSAMGEAIVRKIPSRFPPLEPCYEVVNKQAFTRYPWITFHFDNNADLNLEYGPTFFVVENESGNMEFCLAILPEPDNHSLNAIGAFQQINSRFIYDTKGFKLFFGPENCFKNS